MNIEEHIYFVDDNGDRKFIIPYEDRAEYVALHRRVHELENMVARFQKRAIPNKDNDFIVSEENPFKKRNMDKLTEDQKLALREVMDCAVKARDINKIEFEILFVLNCAKGGGLTMRELMKTQLGTIPKEWVMAALDSLRRLGVRQARIKSAGRPRDAWVWDKPWVPVVESATE